MNFTSIRVASVFEKFQTSFPPVSQVLLPRQNKHVRFDRLLVVHPRDTTGRSRLESQGADFQNVAPLEQRQRKLAEYQEEMQAFMVFMKQIYFLDQ
jgi:hypothetical protein